MNEKKSLKTYAEEYKRLEQELRNIQSDQAAILESVKEVHQVKSASFKAVIAEMMDNKSTDLIEKHTEIVEIVEGLEG